MLEKTDFQQLSKIQQKLLDPHKILSHPSIKQTYKYFKNQNFLERKLNDAKVTIDQYEIDLKNPKFSIVKIQLRKVGLEIATKYYNEIKMARCLIYANLYIKEQLKRNPGVVILYILKNQKK